jgi:protein SCO1/2
MIGLLIAPALALAALLGATPRAVAAFDPFASAAIDDRLGARLPMRLALWDEAGREVRLGDYLADKPLLLAPVDLDCQNICGVTLGGLLDALAGLDRGPGEDFELLVVSIDQQEGPAQGAAAAATYREQFAPAARAHILTGDARVLLDAIGFRYAHDPATGQFAHPAAVAVVTPEGRLARWLYGYPFAAFDLRLALSEAAGGAIGSLADRLWLLCFRYDPTTGAYTARVLGLLQAGGILTTLLLGGGIALALRRERRRRR